MEWRRVFTKEDCNHIQFRAKIDFVNIQKVFASYINCKGYIIYLRLLIAKYLYKYMTK